MKLKFMLAETGSLAYETQIYAAKFRAYIIYIAVYDDKRKQPHFFCII